MSAHDKTDPDRGTAPDHSSFSRRAFLKTVGVGPLAAGVLAPGLAEAQPSVREVGPGEVPIELTVNGKKYALKVEPRVTLLDAMRTRLNITGQKRVCDRGSCGACTMLVDGRSAYACSMLAIEAAGKNIRTVEGLAQGTVLHPVQQALCDTDGLMCGFCTPGFVMSAVALLEKTPSPTVEQARRALDGNICRCGTYTRVLEAALKTPKGGPVADEMQVPEVQAPATAAGASKYAWPKERTLLGKPVHRLDGPQKASGAAKYTYDISRPGMLYGRILRSPHARARVVSIDLGPAQRMAGVKAAMTIVEAGKNVAYQGDEVAAIAAVTEEIAQDALRAIKVQYEVLPHLATIEQALSPGAPPIFEGGNVKSGNAEEEGNLDEGFKAAAHIVEATYSTQVQTHVSLETHGCLCEWDGDKLTAWVSTQAVHGTREGFAQGLNIPQTNVRVITEFMGGGFGSKFGPDVQGIVCAKLAKQANAAVKLMLDRKEEHLASGNRPSAYAKIRAGVAADGTLTAFDAETWGTGGAGAGSGFPLPYIYVFPNRRRAHKDVYINAGQQRAMRAPGHPQGCFITEMLMDELADKVRMDPVAFRLKNLPPEAPNAMWRTYFPLAAKKFEWDKRHPTGDPNPGAVKRGVGCSANRWGGGGRGTRAHCEIYADGSVVMQCGTQDIGVGTKTLVAMITAETLGLPLSSVNAQVGDTNYPFSGGSGGSTTAPSVSPAIRVTAGMALEALAQRVTGALGVPAADIVAVNGRIQSRTDASKGLAWKDACKLLGTEPVMVDGQWQQGLSASGTSGVQFAEVEVDTETGITRVKRIACVQDCGLVVNKLTAESQCYGGIIGGIGFALFEDRILDRNTGVMVNPNMEWYLLPGMSDIPAIDITLMDQSERGVIGIGEPPTIATAAAIANAVANATGVRVRSLPLTPDKVLAALELERSGGTL